MTFFLAVHVVDYVCVVCGRTNGINAIRFFLHSRVCSNEQLICFVQVMSVKALGIAMKLTLQGQNQLVYPQTSVFALVVLTCILTQMNYLNKVLSLIFFESV